MSQDSYGERTRHLRIAPKPVAEIYDLHLEKLKEEVLRKDIPELTTTSWNNIYSELTDKDTEQKNCFLSIINEDYYTILTQEVYPAIYAELCSILEAFKALLPSLDPEKIDEILPKIRDQVDNILKISLQNLCQKIFERIFEKYLSERDPNTKLQKKGTAEKAILDSMRHHEPFALAYLDIDGMKPLNTAFEIHGIVDEIIIKAAKRMQENIRERDVLFRLHQEGDEFLVKFDSEELKDGIGAIQNLLENLFNSPIQIVVDEAYINGLKLRKLNLENRKQYPKDHSEALADDEVKALDVLQNLDAQPIPNQRREDIASGNKKFKININLRATVGLLAFKPTEKSESPIFDLDSARSLIDGADNVLMKLKGDKLRAHYGYIDNEGKIVAVDPLTKKQTTISCLEKGRNGNENIRFLRNGSTPE